MLPGHELTVSLNREGGVVTLTIGENEKREFLVMGGATSVLDDKVTVLARFGTAVEDIDAEAVRATLALAAADAAAPYERLPLVQDAHLMDSILYSGVWAQFNKTHPPKPRV